MNKTATDGMEPTTHGYPITIRLSDEEGRGYLAKALDLPGCMSDGETVEDAMTNVAEAIETWIEGAREEGQPVPNPAEIDHYSGKWVQRVPSSLHCARGVTAPCRPKLRLLRGA